MIDKRSVSLMLMAVALSGCLNQPRPDDPAYAPVSLKHMTPPENHSGSIYQAGYDRSLFEDMRAKRIGDVITVTLLEQTQATKQALTRTEKSTDVQVSNPTIMGAPASFNGSGIIPGLNTTSNTLGQTLQSESEFEGRGQSQQNNQIRGTISVTVSDVLPNGNLVIRGEKWMTLNRGDEFIRLTGIVRPQDVAPDNTVVSTKVANARIAYSGTGEFADSNAIGWLAKFFTSAMWPF